MLFRSVLKAADVSLLPTDFIALSHGNATLWFDAKRIHVAKGIAELLSALAACIAAIVYGIGYQRNLNNPTKHSSFSDPKHFLQARTTPACVEEIKGILGKPVR